MNTWEANGIRIGNTDGEMAGMDILSKFQRSKNRFRDQAPTRDDGTRFRQPSISFEPNKPKTAPVRSVAF
jgi:hypothetical protein